MADPAARTIAERFRVIQPSATVENTERIRAARASGRRILGLSSGDPNIVTDPRIIAAAERAMRGDKTHYSAPAGEPNSVQQSRRARPNAPARATTPTTSWSRPAESSPFSPRSWAS